MLKNRHANISRLQTGIFLAITFAFASCKTTTPTLPPVVVDNTPAPVVITKPTPPPPLNIPARPAQTRMNEPLVRGATNHATLMQAITRAQTTALTSPEQLNEMMDTLSQMFSPGLSSAWLGYGALIGAQNTSFVEGVLETARYQGLDTVIYQLYADPAYVTTLPGARIAATDIQNAWASDIASIGGAGAHIKQQSYEVQKQDMWKKLLADDRVERIRTIGQSKTVRFTLPSQTSLSIAEVGTLRAFDDQAGRKRVQFWQNYGRISAPRSQTFVSQYSSPMNHKALTLAALEILGASGEQSRAWIDGFSYAPRLNQCTTTARLNVEQCLAAGHFKYEDAFCIAQHELTEVSNCLTQSLL